MVMISTVLKMGEQGELLSTRMFWLRTVGFRSRILSILPGLEYTEGHTVVISLPWHLPAIPIFLLPE